MLIGSVPEAPLSLPQKEKGISSLKFGFEQEIDFLEGGMKTKVVGEALFGREGKMRITKTVPNEQVTVIDGEKVWIYTPAYKQVWSGALKDWTKTSVLP